LVVVLDGGVAMSADDKFTIGLPLEIELDDNMRVIGVKPFDESAVKPWRRADGFVVTWLDRKRGIIYIEAV
jgi:hypothetical protein